MTVAEVEGHPDAHPIIRVLAREGPLGLPWLARVQIYSTDRPVPDVGIERVPPATLQPIAGEIKNRTGLPVDNHWA